MTKKPRKTKGSTDAVGLLHRRSIEGDPESGSIPEEEEGRLKWLGWCTTSALRPA